MADFPPETDNVTMPCGIGGCLTQNVPRSQLWSLTHWGRKLTPIRKRCFSAFSFKFWIPIKTSPKIVPKGPNNNFPALVKIMGWSRPGVSDARNWNLTLVRRMRGWVMLGTGVWQWWGGRGGVRCLKLESDSGEEGDEGWVMFRTGVWQWRGSGRGGEWCLEQLECGSGEEDGGGTSDA